MLRIICLLFVISMLNCLDVPSCADPKIPVLRFSYWNGTADPAESTVANVCHDNTHLIIRWTCKDDEVISPYQKCNDPLYNADAVEIFIATEDSYPTDYYELEVSPFGQLFFADIHNPKGYCSDLGTKYINCDLVNYSAQLTPHGWNAELLIKLETISRGKVVDRFKINLFRIDKSSSKPTKYLTWQPTMTPTPCFHFPSVFQ